MTTIYDDLPTVETALPNTRPGQPGKWEGYVRSRLSDGNIRELSVCHLHTGTRDCFGNTGAVQQFDSDADALNAALALSKKVMTGEVEPGTLCPAEK